LQGESSLESISLDQLNQMKYLDLVVKESLRLYPAAPSIARKMTEDVLIGNWQTRLSFETLL
jgi:cytochrome P450 family 4